MMLIPCLLKQFCMFVLKDRGGMLYADGMNFKCTVETSVPTANKCAVTSLQLLKISDMCVYVTQYTAVHVQIKFLPYSNFYILLIHLLQVMLTYEKKYLFYFMINSPQSENPSINPLLFAVFLVRRWLGSLLSISVSTHPLLLCFLSLLVHLSLSFTSLYCAAILLSTPSIHSQ